MRILVLASFFPRPTNPTMGVWALRQILALNRLGNDLRVISMCDWVPRALVKVWNDPKLVSRASCPRHAVWDGLEVDYPRWPRYHSGPHSELAYAHPGPEMRFASLFARRAIRQIASDFAPDVVYAQGTIVNGTLGKDIAAQLDVPLVCQDRDHAEIRDCLRMPARRRHFAEIALASDAVVVVNSAMARLVSDVVPQVDPFVLPEGADLAPRGPERSGAPSVIFCAATLTPRKQIPLLIEAFALVAQDNPDVALRIAGEGPARDEIEARIEHHGLRNRVTLLGVLDHDQVLAEMAVADVFVLLSRDEPFAVVYVEAMAAGLPVVCTEDGGVTDFLQDGVHGCVVPDGDAGAAAAAILGLLENSGLRRMMGEAGRQLVEARLTWAANAQMLNGLFEEVRARR